MASKTTGTKKNAKQSTAKKRQPAKKTTAKSSKSAKTTRKNTASKAAPQEESFLATEILVWVTLAIGILLTISNSDLQVRLAERLQHCSRECWDGWLMYFRSFYSAELRLSFPTKGIGSLISRQWQALYCWSSVACYLS